MISRESVIYIIVFGLEGCWLYALLNAANKSVADSLSVPLLLLTLLVSFGVSKSLKLLRWPKLALTALSWAVWPIIMLLMIKVQLFAGVSFRDPAWLASVPQALSRILVKFEPGLLIIIATAALWWLGRRVAYIKSEFSSIVTEFQFGMVMLILVFFTAYELNLDQSSSVPVTLAFFATGLFGVALSHTQSENWLNFWRKGPWPIVILASIGIILVSGLLISLIFTPDLIQMILKGLKWIWEIINRIFGFFASLFPSQQPAPEISPMPSIPPVGPQDTQGIHFPEWLRPSLTLVWEIVVGGLLLVAIWRIASQIFTWMRRQMSGSGGETEPLKGAIKIDFLNFWKRILFVIFRIKPGWLVRRRLESLPPETASVCQLYGEFLQWAARAGYPRQESQTPVEYRDFLGGVISGSQADLAFITQQYMKTRYGSILPADEELVTLQQTWHNLKKIKMKSKS